MTDDSRDELLTNAINTITEKLGEVLLREFLKLPEELQMNIVLIKSAQLLLANILCQAAQGKDELEKIAEDQGAEMKELTFTCAFTGFADKFNINKH
jgi:hypothetical protein